LEVHPEQMSRQFEKPKKLNGTLRKYLNLETGSPDASRKNQYLRRTFNGRFGRPLVSCGCLSLWFTELSERLDEEAPLAWVKLEMLNTSVHPFK
jgi:hypothetical protein